ncbi:MAG: trypsin-like peptidase domain-containing protein [Candidatus Acidiferrales bacterium]
MRKCSIVIPTALLIFSVFLVRPLNAQRSVPDDNLAYPVLVQFPNELASGLYLNTGAEMYLVTAKHVLLDQNGRVRSGPMVLLSYSKDPKDSGTNILVADMTKLSEDGEVKLHPTADVAVVHIGDTAENVQGGTTASKGPPNSGTFHTIPGVVVRNAAPGGLLSLSIDTIKKYSDVLVANEVLLFGYPTSLGIQGSPQLDPSRPLLRSGIIAGLNPASKSIIIDCPSYPGNSGGPVVEIDRSAFTAKSNVIGVVSQFVPFEEKSLNYPIPYQNVSISNSGYTIVTPMDYVLELVNKAK